MYACPWVLKWLTMTLKSLHDYCHYYVYDIMTPCIQLKCCKSLLFNYNYAGPEPRDFEWSSRPWTAMEVIAMYSTSFNDWM